MRRRAHQRACGGDADDVPQSEARHLEDSAGPLLHHDVGTHLRFKSASALRRGGRQRNFDDRTIEIQSALRSDHLENSPLVVDAMGNVVL